MKDELDEYEKGIIVRHERLKKLVELNKKYWATPSEQADIGHDLANAVDAYLKVIFVDKEQEQK